MSPKNELSFQRIVVPVAHFDTDANARTGVLFAPASSAMAEAMRVDPMAGVRIADPDGGSVYDVVAETVNGQDRLLYMSRLAIRDALSSTRIPDSELAFLAQAFLSGDLRSREVQGGAWHPTGVRIKTAEGEGELISQWSVPLTGMRQRSTPEEFADQYLRCVAANPRNVRDTLRELYNVSIWTIDDWIKQGRSLGLIPPAKGARGKHPRKSSSTRSEDSK